MNTRWLILTVPALLIGAAALHSCKNKTPEREVSKVKAGGADTVRPHWLLSPEIIARTITRTWGIAVDDDETQRYLASVHAMLGGTSVARRGVVMTNPNELYVLTLDNLSAWVARRIVEKQTGNETTATTEDPNAPFAGYEGSVKITDPGACKACFEDGTKAWCDCRDGITTSYLSTARLAAADLVDTTPRGKEVRKRLMHNVQDIAEFLGCSAGIIDNNLMVGPAGAAVSAPALLLDTVFIPVVQTGITVETERVAWRRVVHVILMGQGCFLKM